MLLLPTGTLNLITMCGDQDYSRFRPAPINYYRIVVGNCLEARTQDHPLRRTYTRPSTTY